MLQFIEFLKVENEHGTLETVEHVFCVDTTEDKLRAEFEQFIPDHDTAEDPTRTPHDFWSKERQFARIKMMEWEMADRTRPIGDAVHAQILKIISTPSTGEKTYSFPSNAVRYVSMYESIHENSTANLVELLEVDGPEPVINREKNTMTYTFGDGSKIVVSGTEMEVFNS